MRFCTTCGTKLDSTQLFCKECGTKVKNQNFQAPEAAPFQPQQSESRPVPVPSPRPNAISPAQSEISRQDMRTSKSKGVRMIALSVVGVLIIPAASYFLYKEYFQKEPKTESASSNETKDNEENDEIIFADDEKEDKSSDDSKLSVEEAGGASIKRIEELSILADGQRLDLGKWKSSKVNGIIYIEANEIPSKTLQEIYDLYDQNNLEPLKAWAKKVYSHAEDIALGDPFVIAVGNECAAEFPETLPTDQLLDFSGSCGYSIPVLEGSNQTDLTLITDVSVFTEDSLTSLSSTEFIFPDSHVRDLGQDEINSLTKEELRIARNEIYARHGYIFNSDDLKAYFLSKSWYTEDPSYKGALNPIEKSNVDRIVVREESLN